MKTKKVLLATNLFVSHFALKFANLLSDGLMGIEIYPEFISEPSEENVCVIAYVKEVPEDVLDFLKKHQGTGNVNLYLDDEAWRSLGQLEKQLDSFIIRDEPIQVVTEVQDLLELLHGQK